MNYEIKYEYGGEKADSQFRYIMVDVFKIEDSNFSLKTIYIELYRRVIWDIYSSLKNIVNDNSNTINYDNYVVDYNIYSPSELNHLSNEQLKLKLGKIFTLVSISRIKDDEIVNL